VRKSSKIHRFYVVLVCGGLLLAFSQGLGNAQGQHPVPAGFEGVKVFNNLVWEVLRVGNQVRESGVRSFSLLSDRWIFLRSRARVGAGAEVGISLDGEGLERAVIRHSTEGESTLEAMRFLKAGTHEVQIVFKGYAEVNELVVRAVPMLQFAFYGANPHVSPYGPYDWKFLKKYVLSNVNTMFSGGNAGSSQVQEWKARGGDWITVTGVPSVPEDEEIAIDEAFKRWSEASGMTSPLMDGIIIDEFSGGNNGYFDAFRKAIDKIYENARSRDKKVMLYGGGLFSGHRSAEFARTCLKHGGYICWERYLTEQPTEVEARKFINSKVLSEMPLWEKHFPEIAPQLCMVFGYLSQPPESLNIDPSVDYKVYMDMQFRALATHPAFFGLGGVQWYHCGYADEENVRWASMLYRHYAIEGNTEPLTQDPYRLTHIRNPDFADGMNGWTVAPAEPGSAGTRQYAGYSWLQGRYPRTKMGDTFLWMKRNAKKPNVFSQEIRGLEPGRLYSMKMITADYQDLMEQQSCEEKDAVSIKIDGAQMLTGPKESFQFTYPNCYSHQLGKFDAQYKYYMNYHWQIFRALGDTARLIVSDWANGNEPGAPAGQELMYNFIEIQPYLETSG